MAKIDLVPVIANSTLTTINENFQKIANELQNEVLYRDNPVGETNTMENLLDMNGNRIINLPAPVSPSEAARLQDVQAALAGGAANLITFLPTGDITSSNVQAAIEEVDGELHDHINDLDSAHVASSIGYTLSGVGTAARNVFVKVSENVSVKDFGAVGDGVTDDTVAWQNCLNFIALAGGGKLYAPKGRYKITSTLTNSVGNLCIQGDGINASVIAPTFGNANLFTFNGAWTELHGIMVDTSGVTWTSGYLFEFTTSSGNILIDGITTVVGFNVVGFTGVNPAQTYVINSTLNGFKGDGINYGPNYGGFGVLSNLNLNNTADYCEGAAIRCQNGDTFTWSNVQTQCSQYGITVAPISGGFVRNIFASNVLSDGVGRSFGAPGWHFNSTIPGMIEIARIHLSNCWAGALPSHGYLIQGPVGINLNNCIAVSNVGHGIYLTGSPTPEHTIINGCTISGNSLNSANVNSGIKVDNFVNNFTITNNTIKQLASPGVGNTQKYGIEIEGTNHDDYIVRNNRIRGNLTGGVLDSGTGVNKSVGDNV